MIDFHSKAIKALELWKLREFDDLIELHGMDLFMFVLQLSIQDIAPNLIGSYSPDKLVKRLYQYYSAAQTLHSLHLTHETGI